MRAGVTRLDHQAGPRLGSKVTSCYISRRLASDVKCRPKGEDGTFRQTPRRNGETSEFPQRAGRSNVLGYGAVGWAAATPAAPSFDTSGDGHGSRARNTGTNGGWARGFRIIPRTSLPTRRQRWRGAANGADTAPINSSSDIEMTAGRSSSSFGDRRESRSSRNAVARCHSATSRTARCSANSPPLTACRVRAPWSLSLTR